MRCFPLFRTLAITAGLAAALPTVRGGIEDATAAGAKPDLPWEKASVGFGGMVTFFDSTVSFGLNQQPGVNINAEEILGLNETLTVFRAGAMYRPGDSLRHQIDFYYASFHRSGDATLSSSLTIGGITYPVGAQVSTVFNFDIFRVSYSYAFVQDERMRIAAGAGLYGVPLKYGLEITTGGGRSSVDGADTTVPLPALSLRGEFQLVRGLFLRAGVDGMYLEIAQFKGAMLDLNAGLEYQPWKHLGLGVGYSYTGMHVEEESSSADYPGANFIGKVDVRYSGLMLYGKLRF